MMSVFIDDVTIRNLCDVADDVIKKIEKKTNFKLIVKLFEIIENFKFNNNLNFFKSFFLIIKLLTSNKKLKFFWIPKT